VNTLDLKPIPADDGEIIVSAEQLRMDEGGIDLLVGGETELSASFTGLDNFELAFRVMPESFELEDSPGFEPDWEAHYLKSLKDDELEQGIWLALQEYAERKGLKK
jgi:hypothetical protein